jgi:hypothetical protein
MSQETITKREIGFLAKKVTETTTQTAPTAVVEEFHDSTPTERILTKLLNVSVLFVMLYVPVFLAVSFSYGWLGLWCFMYFIRKYKAGRD